MNNNISERGMFMLMMENAEKKTAKKPTCKEAFEHRKELEYEDARIVEVKDQYQLDKLIWTVNNLTNSL